MRNRSILIAVCFLLLLAAAGSFGESAGQYSTGWLKIGMGARAMALGDAYTAVADDVSAVYWNPAGLSTINYGQLMLQYSLWFADTGYHAFAFCHPLSKSGERVKSSLGAGLVYLDYGSILRTTDLASTQNISPEYFSSNSFMGILSYSRVVMKSLWFGATAKYFSDTIDNTSAGGMAADAGILFKPEEILTLGAAVQNIGPSLYSHALPYTVRAGAQIKLAPFLLTAGASQSSGADPQTSMGVELKANKSLALRFGYLFSMPDTGSGGVLPRGVSFGFGINHFRNLGIDIALAGWGGLGYRLTPLENPLRISLYYYFEPLEMLMNKEAYEPEYFDKDEVPANYFWK